jgi:3,4-dihydroxy 2-butanone 4-phosphate synthase/GTP cyclohydrolase II
MSPQLARVTAAIEAIRNGGMVVMVDDEDRENEGDLVIAARLCTPAAVNFMCKEGRGLICLSLAADRVEALGLPMMVPTDADSMGTAFTVSIEARDGVTTGISAADRARTIAVASDPERGAADLVSPGHVFPLRAKPGGVLVRSGHTEGSIDLSQLAGCGEAAVICEIMRDDGEMARMDDLEAFAARHKIPIVTIADLIEYRLQRESLLEKLGERPFRSATLETTEGWTMHVWRSRVDPLTTFVALTFGDVAEGEEPVLLRAQRGNVLGDVLGFAPEGQPNSGVRIRAALRRIEEAGRGILLYVLGDGFDDLDDELAPRGPSSPGLRPNESGFRDFGLGAQVLTALGVERIEVLTNNPRKIIGLAGFGIEVAGTRLLEVD